MHCKCCDHFFLFLLLGVNENANETPDICPMKGLTKGKITALEIRASHQSKTGQKCFVDRLKFSASNHPYSESYHQSKQPWSNFDEKFFILKFILVKLNLAHIELLHGTIVIRNR